MATMRSRESEAASQDPAEQVALLAAPAALGAIGALAPANALALQRSAGNRAVARLAKNPRRLAKNPRILARYNIRGPWNTKHSVHEVLTLLAIRQASQAARAQHIRNLTAGVEEDELPSLSQTGSPDLEPENQPHYLHQFLRGVVWADDPLGLLFDNEEDMTDYSSGIQWYWNFDPNYRRDRANLEARSHFGDLQFFHSMATADSESAATTKQQALEWARFVIDVAAGRTDGDRRLETIPLTHRLFPSNQSWTIKRLFGWGGASDRDVRQRAVGILFHLIQDSHAHGHVDRDPATDDIREFHSYTNQDDEEHGHFDAWGPGSTLGEHVRNTPGAASAVDQCAHVLVMMEQNLPTDDIVGYLDHTVLRLAPSTRQSGPGDEFRRRPPHRMPSEADVMSDD
jgi:hypothetical protein